MNLRESIIEAYQERAAIMQYEGGLTREDAERAAIDDMAAIHGDWVRAFLSKLERKSA